jgi:hypothetical protein
MKGVVMAGGEGSRLRPLTSRQGTPRIPGRALAVPIEWCDVSEERVEVTNRRDSRRPTRHLDGIRAVVWGCGGLGSWVAEFLTRAGVARLSVCDRPTPIHGGLLARRDRPEHMAAIEDELSDPGYWASADRAAESSERHKVAKSEIAMSMMRRRP